MGPRLDSRGRKAVKVSVRYMYGASMGPRLDSRGRGVRDDLRRMALELQWGRGWTAAEGCTSNDHVAERLRLQWGRGWTAAEGSCSSSFLRALNWLQWGRGWTAAEGSSCAAPGIWRLSFNGAAAGQPRKEPFSGHSIMVCPCFNGAAAGQPRKANLPGPSGLEERLQWGRGWTAAGGSRIWRRA